MKNPEYFIPESKQVFIKLNNQRFQTLKNVLMFSVDRENNNFEVFLSNPNYENKEILLKGTLTQSELLHFLNVLKAFSDYEDTQQNFLANVKIQEIVDCILYGDVNFDVTADTEGDYLTLTFTSDYMNYINNMAEIDLDKIIKMFTLP